MWRSRDDDDEDDDGGMFGFRGGSMAMSRKMMADEEVEWVTPGQEPNKTQAEIPTKAASAPVPAASNPTPVEPLPLPKPALKQTFIPAEVPAVREDHTDSLKSQTNYVEALNDSSSKMDPISQFSPQSSGFQGQNNGFQGQNSGFQGQNSGFQGQPIFINQYGQPVNQYGQVLQSNEFGQVLPIQQQQYAHQNQSYNSPNTPSSSGSINPMQASVFGGGSNAIPLSKQFAAGNQQPLDPIQMEYLQAVQQQSTQFREPLKSSSPTTAFYPQNQIRLNNELSYASTLSSSSNTTLPLFDVRRNTDTSAQGIGQGNQMIRELSAQAGQLNSRESSLGLNKSISGVSIHSNALAQSRSAESFGSLVKGGKKGSMELSEALAKEAKQVRMQPESSNQSFASQNSGPHIPPPSPSESAVMGRAGKKGPDSRAIMEDQIDPELKKEYERAVNAFGGKKPEDSDDEEGVFDKGIWGGGTSSMYLSKSSLGSREASFRSLGSNNGRSSNKKN